jgi:glycosyltransferase involved in cell wall biosynthesis
LKVSVIIPLFNQARFIERAISSALAQDEVVEVVVVDDGSEDGGRQVLEELFGQDKQVRIFQHHDGKRHGVGATRNLGMSKARSPYLAFLDADDYMLPRRFERTREKFLLNDDADGVCEALGKENDDSVTMMLEPSKPEELFFDMAPFGKKGHFSVCGLTIKASILEKTGGFSERLEIGEDTEWLARLVLTGKVYCGDLQKPVAMRTVNGRNITATSQRAPGDKVLMASMLLEWAHKRGESNRVMNTLLNLFLKYHYEKNRLFGNQAAWKKKREDIRAFRFLMTMKGAFKDNPKFRYFAKTVVGWPVDKHFNYYEP